MADKRKDEQRLSNEELADLTDHGDAEAEDEEGGGAQPAEPPPVEPPDGGQSHDPKRP